MGYFIIIISTYDNNYEKTIPETLNLCLHSVSIYEQWTRVKNN